MQNLLRERMHRVVDQFADEDLDEMWRLMSEFYWDGMMLRAIQSAKRSLTPGDSLTQEEAMQSLASHPTSDFT